MVIAGFSASATTRWACHLRVCYTGQEYTSVLPDAGVIRTELPSFELPNVNPVSKKKKAPSDKDNVTSAAPSKRMKTRASKGKLPIVASDEGPHSVSSGSTAENTLHSDKAVDPSFEKTSASSDHDTAVAKSFSVQPFVPLWDVCNGDLYDNPRVCRDVATALPTPAQKSAVAQLSNTALTDELLTSWVQLGSFVTESLNRWSGCHDKAKEKTTSLLNQLVKEGERVSALEKQVSCLSEEKKQAVVSVEVLKEEMRVKEAQLCDSKKELEKEVEMLAKSRAMFEKEQAMFKTEETKMKASLEQLSQENRLLSARVEELSQDREWLIVQGFKHVVELLHRSPEYLEPLAAIQKASHAYGMHSGIRAGYKYAAAGRAMDTVAYFAPDSKAKLHRAVHAFEEMQFPFLDLVSKDGAVPLSTLKSLMPHNAETVVAIGGQLSSSQLSAMTSPSSMLPPRFPQGTSYSLDVTPAVPESPASVMKESADPVEKAASK
ncbi:hypothetical protein E3N88_09028 [Mikania micrantha]|uniref:Uncharacterized protein n=1 Tax=Mikania micrantha TaxID=192012 RepID=A0A5N6PII9_9ASTR|nr:hypothetical protein E3N88_09028 [Mikania micrantha]